MRDDRAVSNSVAILMMIATVTGVSAAVFVHVMYGGDGTVPKTIALEGYGPMPDSRTKDFRVTNLTGNVTWGSVTVELEGNPLRYDGGQPGGSGYCVSLDGARCVPKDSWDPFKVPAKVGQHVIVHGPELLGKKVNVLLDSKSAWTGFVNA